MGSSDMTLALAIQTEPSPGSAEFERTATYMAREFEEATTEIARLMLALHAQTKRLDEAFRTDGYSQFSAELYYFGHRYDLEDPPLLVNEMGRRAWDVIIDKLGVKNVMSVAKRQAFDAQLSKGELPPICEQTISGILLGLVDQAKDFVKDAAREVFDMLRPRGSLGGQYATNNAFRVGRRVILPYRVTAKYSGDGFHVNYGREQELTAIDGIFHMLDGKGIMRENKGPLVKAINETVAISQGRGETDYFRFRCFKNRNLHLEFKNLELVKQLNLLATGERVLGVDVD